MKTADMINKAVSPSVKQETSGLIRFLSGVHGEAANFDKAFDFGVRPVASPPTQIDGNAAEIKSVGFVIVRENALLSGRTYCLYTLLKGDTLSAYVGVYSDGSIETVRELAPLKDFKKGRTALLDWLRQLMKVSCEKP
jgi:hypothetical protein